jgi:hypothetical protein
VQSPLAFLYATNSALAFIPESIAKMQTEANYLKLRDLLRG